MLGLGLAANSFDPTTHSLGLKLEVPKISFQFSTEDNKSEN